MLLFDFFREPPYAEPIKDEAVIKKTYKHFRLRMFYACFIGYIVFHFVKKNLAVAMPAISRDLGYTNTELGVLGASLYLTYGIGKFVNGILSDSSDVRKFMPTALFLSAIANLCFLASTKLIAPGEFTFFGLPSATILLWLLAFFWGANGWFQSGGFPPIAKTLSYWYSNPERGRVWAMWSTSHQFGVMIAVWMSGYLISKLGWEWAFIVPSILCIICSIWLYDRLRDRPQTIGLPDIECYKGTVTESSEVEEDTRSYFQIYKESILCNKVMWLLALSYIFVYVIRYGTEDWFVKYLVEFKNNTDLLASSKLSVLAGAGIFGVMAAGTISDTLFKGKRAPVNIIYLVGVVLSILGLCFAPAHMHWLDFVCAAAIGFFTGGPQMLIGGLCAIEASSKKVASAATGFTGVFGYVGAVISSVGTGVVVDKLGWNGAIGFWVSSAIMCILICLILLKKEYAKKA